MLEHGLSGLATLWLQSGFVTACGLMMSRFVQNRSATLAATVLRAMWIGVALCLLLTLSNFGSIVSHRALWSVALPTTLVQTVSAPTPIAPTPSGSTADTSLEPLPSASSQAITTVPEPDADSGAPSSTRSSTQDSDARPVQTFEPSSSAATSANAASIVATSVTATLPQKPLSILRVLLALWLAGSAALLLWITFCAWQMRRVVRTSTRIEDGAWRDELRDLCALLRMREPILLRSDLARSPFLTGLLRPCIVLPRGDFGAAQRFVLLHELTHLQRRDLWWNALSRVLCALLWMQPLLWMLQRKSERIGEEVCDETVVSQGESAHQYAQCLLDLAQSWRPTRGERTIGAGVVPLRSGLARRIQNILDESRRRTMIVSRRARWIVGVATLSIVAASLSLVAVEAIKPPTPLALRLQWQQSTPKAVLTTVAWSASGRTLVSGSWGGQVRLYDAQSGRLTRQWTAHKDRVLAVSFSPAGSIASGSRDGTIKIWNLSGQLLRTLQPREGWVRSLAWSPDGLVLASGSRTVQLWNPRTGQLLRRLPTSRGNSVGALRFSPDGQQLAGGSTYRTAYVWNVQDGTLLQKLADQPSPSLFGDKYSPNARPYGHASEVTGVAWEPDGKTLLTGCWDGFVREWNVQNGALNRMFMAAPAGSGVLSLSLSRDGQVLVTGGLLDTGGSLLKVWDVPSFQLQRDLSSPHQTAMATDFSPGGKSFAATRGDQNSVTLQVWNVTANQSSTRLPDASSPEGVVRAFASAMNSKDLDEAARYVEGGAPVVNREVQAQVAAAKFSVAVSDFKTEIAGTTATVIFHEAMTAPKNSNGDLGTTVRWTTLSLRQSNGAWKLVSSFPNRPERTPSTLQGATEMLSPRFKSKIMAWAKNRGRASIVGRMLDENGRPVAGARIHVTMISQDIIRQFKNLYNIFQIESLNIEPRVIALFNQYVQTGRDGTFRVNGLTSALYDLSPLPIPERQIPRLIPTGALHIKAREGSSTRSRNLKMLTGAVVSVRVIDNATRKPLPGVELALNAIRNQKLEFYWPGKTDANGRALLGSLQGRSHVMLKFDYVKRLNGLYVLSNGVPYLPLPRAGEKTPRPINSTYAAGQNVLVSRNKPNEVVFKLQRYVDPRTASSSDIRAAHQADALKKWAKNRGAAQIVGRVVREDGKPAANIPVSVQMTDRAAIKGLSSDPIMTLMAGNVPTTLRDLFFQNSKTDGNGNFQIRGLTTARYRISALLDQRAWQKDGAPVPALAALNSPIVAARERSSTRSPEITLTSGGLMNVQIVDDATDKPLSLVFLVVQSWPGNAQKPSYYNRTNAEGRAVFRVNPGEVRIAMGVASAPGAKHDVVAASGKFYNLRPVKVLGGKIPPANFGGTIATVTKDQIANVQIRLKTYVAPIPTPTPPIQPLTRADGVLTGRVVYENGRPASNIRVSAMMQKTARWEVLRSARLAYGNFGEPASARRWQQVRNRVEQSTLTRDDGTFQFSGLTTAPYNIYVNNTDDRFFLRATSPWVAKAVEGAWARDGQTVRRAQPLVLTRGSLVRGRVLDSKSGQPLGGVILAYEGPQNPTSSESVIFIKSDANGRFTARLADGTTKLYVAGPNVYTGNFVFADTKQRAVNTYRVRTSRGTYGVMSRLEFNLDGGAIQRLKGWGDRISLQAQKGQTRRMTIRLRRLLPATQTSLMPNIRASNGKAAPVRGRVVYADGRPAAGVRVMLQPVNGVSSKEYQAWQKPRTQAVERLLTREGGKLTLRQTLNKLFDISRKFGAADITRADGTYRLSGLQLTQFNILVDTLDEIYVNRPTNILPTWVAAAAQIRTPLARTTELVNDLVLTKGAIIRGRVLDRATGQPLPRVYVACHGPQNPRSGASVTDTFTDAQGRYAMRVAPGTSYVYISGNSRLKAIVHFEKGSLVDRYEKDLSVIKSGRNFYHADGLLQVQLDNTSPRWTHAGAGSALIEVPAQLGQTRTLDFLLDKLVVKRKGGNTDVYVPGKLR